MAQNATTKSSGSVPPLAQPARRTCANFCLDEDEVLHISVGEHDVHGGGCRGACRTSCLKEHNGEPRIGHRNPPKFRITPLVGCEVRHTNSGLASEHDCSLSPRGPFTETHHAVVHLTAEFGDDDCRLTYYQVPGDGLPSGGLQGNRSCEER